MKRCYTLIITAALNGSAACLSAQIVSDGSFESVNVGTDYHYDPSGFPWSFSSTSGVIQPVGGSNAFGGPTAGYSPNDGVNTQTQYALLQTNLNDSHSNGSPGSISEQIDLPSDGAYIFDDSTARRTDNLALQASYVVQIDGTTVSPSLFASANSFADTSFAFQSTAGPHTLTLLSTGPSDTTSFVDNISVQGFAGGFTTRAFLGDSDSGISSSKTYTHAVDFNGTSPVVVNGVSFAAGGAGDQSGTLGYILNGPAGNFTGFTNNLVGNINSLATNFFYGGNPASFTLQGLTPGQIYTTTFYGVGFGNPGGRFETIMDGEGNSIVFDENQEGAGNGVLLQDTFEATAGTETFSFNVDTIGTTTTGDTFHFYGFTNEVVPLAVPEPGTASLLILGLSAFASQRRRRAAR